MTYYSVHMNKPQEFYNIHIVTHTSLQDPKLIQKIQTNTKED